MANLYCHVSIRYSGYIFRLYMWYASNYDIVYLVDSVMGMFYLGKEYKITVYNDKELTFEVFLKNPVNLYTVR